MSGNGPEFDRDRPPRVGVVMPTYLRPDLLRRALASVQAQTFESFVIYVCDNGNDPQTRRVVGELADPRFRYVARPRNLGMLGNVLRGFQEAGAELIMELDDDDRLLPDALDRLVAPFDEIEDLVLSFGDLCIVDESGAPVPPDVAAETISPARRLTPGLQTRFREIAARGFIETPAALVRRDVLAAMEFPPQASTAYDLHLCIQAARHGGGAYYVGRPVVCYCVHGGADSERNYPDQLAAAEFVLMAAKAGAVGEEAHILAEELANIRVEQIRTALRQRRWRVAARHARQAFGGSPGAGVTMTWYARVRLKPHLRRSRRRRDRAEWAPDSVASVGRLSGLGAPVRGLDAERSAASEAALSPVETAAPPPAGGREGGHAGVAAP